MSSETEIPLEQKKHRVTIEYCVTCDYSDQALRVAGELMHSYQHVLEGLVFKMGSHGVFTVEVDGKTLFSNQEEDRHPEPGEVLARFRDYVGADVVVYPGG